MRKNSKFKNMGKSNKIFFVFNCIFWTVCMFIVLYPLYLVCITSVSDPNAIYRGEVTWRPIGFSLAGYKAVLNYKEIWSSYLNSIIYTAAGIFIGIMVTLAAAYALSGKAFPGKRLVNVYILIPMFFSGGLIPTFLTMKNVGLYNSIWIMILTGCVSIWNLMVARTYIQNTIPQELYEAAKLDGASHFQYFFRVVLPLSKTISAVLAVYYGVSKWNDWFTGVVYIKDRALLPLQTVLREILAVLQVDMSSDEFLMSMSENMSSMQEAIKTANMAKYCIIVISTAPVIMLYAFLQKYFEKGVMIGSLKG